MKTYRNGKHIQFRKPNGRFHTPSLEDFGFDTNGDYQVCSNCGYGEKEKWIPVLKSGYCPECKCQEKEPKKIPLTKKAAELKKQISEINNKSFLNKADLNKLTDLQREYNKEYRKCKEYAFLPNQTAD